MRYFALKLVEEGLKPFTANDTEEIIDSLIKNEIHLILIELDTELFDLESIKKIRTEYTNVIIIVFY